MNDIDISRVDLNLLKSFQALLAERHVGRAAARMNVTQSAMSHTLGRLRETFGDPLFVRTAKGLDPTSRALDLYGPLNFVLSQIRTLLTPKSIDPAQLKVRFRLHTHDFIAASYLPNAFATIRQQAPGIVFDVQIFGSSSYQRLDHGEVDLIVGAGLKAQPKLMQKSFAEEDLVCLLDSRHAVLKNWRAEAVFRYPHVKLSLLDARDDPVAVYGKANGMPSRQIGLFTETLQLQPAMLVDTPLIAFLPVSLARQGEKNLGLTLRPCPFELPRLTIKGIWHERSQNDPVHQWVRNNLAQQFEN